MTPGWRRRTTGHTILGSLMTDDADGSGATCPKPSQQNLPEPRRRRHRRATRPATGGDPARSIPVQSGRDDTDAGWAPDAPDNGTEDTRRAAKERSDRPESAEDRWWREQRPPHWE